MGDRLSICTQNVDKVGSVWQSFCRGSDHRAEFLVEEKGILKTQDARVLISV